MTANVAVNACLFGDMVNDLIRPLPRDGSFLLCVRVFLPRDKHKIIIASSPQQTLNALSGLSVDIDIRFLSGLFRPDLYALRAYNIPHPHA